MIIFKPSGRIDFNKSRVKTFALAGKVAFVQCKSRYETFFVFFFSIKCSSQIKISSHQTTVDAGPNEPDESYFYNFFFFLYDISIYHFIIVKVLETTYWLLKDLKVEKKIIDLPEQLI